MKTMDGQTIGAVCTALVVTLAGLARIERRVLSELKDTRKELSGAVAKVNNKVSALDAISTRTARFLELLAESVTSARERVAVLEAHKQA